MSLLVRDGYTKLEDLVTRAICAVAFVQHSRLGAPLAQLQLWSHGLRALPLSGAAAWQTQ